MPAEREKARRIWDRFDIGRGSIQLLVLGILSHHKMCGYQIAKKLRETDEELGLKYGVIYPLLERLERKKLVKHERQPGSGPSGLYVYSLTPAGRKALEKSERTWQRVIEKMRTLLHART